MRTLRKSRIARWKKDNQESLARVPPVGLKCICSAVAGCLARGGLIHRDSPSPLIVQPEYPGLESSLQLRQGGRPGQTASKKQRADKGEGGAHQTQSLFTVDSSLGLRRRHWMGMGLRPQVRRRLHETLVTSSGDLSATRIAVAVAANTLLTDTAGGRGQARFRAPLRLRGRISIEGVVRHCYVESTLSPRSIGHSRMKRGAWAAGGCASIDVHLGLPCWQHLEAVRMPGERETPAPR